MSLSQDNGLNVETSTQKRTRCILNSKMNRRVDLTRPHTLAVKHYIELVDCKALREEVYILLTEPGIHSAFVITFKTLQRHSLDFNV